MVTTSLIEKLGIVILNYQSYQETIRLVEDLQKQKDVELQIIIVDNCSPNDSYRKLQQELPRFSNTTLLLSPGNHGYASGNNVGLEYLTTNPPRYVSIMNNDIYLDDEYLLSKIITIHKELDRPGLVAPCQMDASGKAISTPKSISLVQDIFNCFFLYRFFTSILKNGCKYNKELKYQKVNIVPGAFFLIDFSFFQNLNFFDTNTFLYGEERILTYKVHKANHCNYILPQLSYRHVHSKTIRIEIDFVERYRCIFNSVLYYTKNYRNHSHLKMYLLRAVQKWSLLELYLLKMAAKIFRNLYYVCK